jgi:sulfoxide reductase catalytic subunit YedY
MLIKPPQPIPASEITPKEHWLRRRELMAGAAAGLGLAALGGLGGLLTPGQVAAEEKIPGLITSPLSTDETLTSREDVTGYNNFYELGTEKDDPARYAGLLKPRPWTVRVDGACAAPGEIGIEDILTGFPQEERIYRLRCVEAWAMVIPWVGFPLVRPAQRA